jgi:hypothetical protein
MAFYPFAFDMLRLTARGWSLMITVYYGTNLLAMLLMGYFKVRSTTGMWKVILTCYSLTAIIWMSYCFIRNIGLVLSMQFLEGTIFALSGIFMATVIQISSPKGFVARISGLNDIGSGIGKIAGLGMTYVIMKLGTCMDVFFSCSVIFLLFSVILLFRTFVTSHKRRGI